MSRSLLAVSLFFISACISSPSGKERALFDLQLRSVNSETIRLSEIKNNKASVFVFLSPDCPLSQKYSLQLKKLSETFASEKIAFYTVFPGKLYSREEIKFFLTEYKLDLPSLIDAEKELTACLAVTVTPEAVLVNDSGNVLYRGAIDNWFEDINKKREIVTENYLSDAIESFLQNKIIILKQTKAVGCIIE